MPLFYQKNWALTIAYYCISGTFLLHLKLDFGKAEVIQDLRKAVNDNIAAEGV